MKHFSHWKHQDPADCALIVWSYFHYFSSVQNILLCHNDIVWISFSIFLTPLYVGLLFVTSWGWVQAAYFLSYHSEGPLSTSTELIVMLFFFLYLYFSLMHFIFKKLIFSDVSEVFYLWGVSCGLLTETQSLSSMFFLMC